MRIATQVSSSGGSIATIDLLRVAIAGQDHLLLALEQGVECVKELLLRALLLGKELNVVDEQRIERAVSGLEIVHRIVLQRLDHVAHESLAVHVGNARVGVAFLDLVRDRMHQMRLAEPDAAVDEQRVVGLARISGDLDRRRLRELVALALDEAVEREIRIDRAAEDGGRDALRTRARANVGIVAGAIQDGGCRQRTAARADVEHDFRDRSLGQCPHQFLDAWQGIGAKPINHIPVRRQKSQLPIPLDRLERPNPGIELLLREFALEHSQTAIPQRLRQERSP
jgi:hypothetical protein